jgi:hypothetical protein
MFTPGIAVKPRQLTITVERLGNGRNPATFATHPSVFGSLRVVPHARFPQNFLPSQNLKPIDKPDTYHD